MESKAPELLAGYFARLDYVSHLILEFGFCFGSMDYSPQLNLLGHQTLVANHLLNLGCTLADAGMVSAILWSFEVREILAEQIEAVFGSRLHCNFAVSTFVSLDQHGFDVNLASIGLSQTLVNAVTGIKIAKQRLLGTFVVSWHAARSDLLSGVLTSAYGFSDTELSHELSLDELFTANPIAAGSLSCSLGRHLLRIRQLDRARVSALIFRTRLSSFSFRSPWFSRFEVFCLAG